MPNKSKRLHENAHINFLSLGHRGRIDSDQANSVRSQGVSRQSASQNDVGQGRAANRLRPPTHNRSSAKSYHDFNVFPNSFRSFRNDVCKFESSQPSQQGIRRETPRHGTAGSHTGLIEWTSTSDYRWRETLRNDGALE